MSDKAADLRRNARRLLKKSGWWAMLSGRNVLYVAALVTGLLQVYYTPHAHLVGLLGSTYATCRFGV